MTVDQLNALADASDNPEARKLRARVLENHYIPRGHDKGTEYIMRLDARAWLAMRDILVPGETITNNDGTPLIEV